MASIIIASFYCINFVRYAMIVSTSVKYLIEVTDNVKQQIMKTIKTKVINIATPLLLKTLPRNIPK